VRWVASHSVGGKKRSNYYWALWKWRMKEVHDADFKFVPANCVASLLDTLSTPVPAHLLRQTPTGDDDRKPPDEVPGPKSAPLVGGLSRLPPPVSHLLRQGGGVQLSTKGKEILRAIQAPIMTERPRCLPGREAILRALTDGAYA